MDIRRATADDWAAARDIRLRALREAPQAFCATFEGEQDRGEQLWRDRLSRSATFLAWESGVPVGTVAGKSDDHEVESREFVAMWVDPSVRGAGVATALIDSVVGWAETEGALAVSLWVAEDNVSARRLYEKCGFALTDQRDFMRAGTDQLRMRKTLN